MRIYILLILSLLLFGCKEQPNQESMISKSQKSITKQTSLSEKTEKPKPVTLLGKRFKNFSFDLPDNFELQENLSNSNKQVYINKNENILFTIDIEFLPNGFENQSIKDIIINLNEFGSSINQNNRLNFSDFKLLNTTYSDFGNTLSVFVSQLSTDISGSKNMEMMVDSHFVISEPYYCNFTFSYPNNSFSSQNIVSKIKNSFKFKETVKQ